MIGFDDIVQILDRGPIFKDKLFSFIDYEGVRNHSGGSGAASVLSAAERQGNFSAAIAPNYALV